MTQALKIVLVTLVANLVVCGNAWAEQTWLCSIGSAVAVDEDGTVGPPDLGDKERPTFFRVDAAKKELTLLAPASRRGEVTKIEMVHESQGQRIFSGVENGRSLNLIIADDGRLSLSVLGDGVVWSVFGHALPEGETRAATAGDAKTQGVEPDVSNATSGPVSFSSDDGELAACEWTDGYRPHAVVSQGPARCKLVRRK